MQCPGQDTRFWDAAAVFESKCPKCGGIVEFFKDDSTRKCGGCGTKVVNPRIDFGCASYCPYAEQCLGTLPPALLAKKQDLLKDRVAVEVKKYFGMDFRRIGHALKVARRAAEIIAGQEEKKEELPGLNPAVVSIAAYLHDIGIREAERKYQSASPAHQHREGPPAAREILTGLGASPGLIDEVCDIIGHHHHPRSEETANFKILYDADLITNLEEKHSDKAMAPEQLQKIVKGSFLTESGRIIAAEVLGGS